MIQISLKEGHHRPASETSFQWGFADRPLNSGLAAFSFSGDPDQYC